MANQFAPFGFADSGILNAAAPNYALSARTILSTNTTAIYFGDPVSQATGTTGIGTGYIQRASPGQVLAITSLSWATGIMTITFTATTAPAVGSYLTFGTMSTATTLSGTTQGPILSSTTTTALFAFPVTQSTDTGSAVVYQPVSGIFVGCEYNSTAQRKPVWSPWWPGTSDATGNGAARVIDAPGSTFRVQGNGIITQAMVGQNATFAFGGTALGSPAATVGTGNSTTGRSTACLDITGATVAPGYLFNLPFRITQLITDPPGSNGTDTTTACNWCYVTFNNQDYRAGTAGI